MRFFVGVVGVLVLFAACKNPFFPALESPSADPEVPVISVQPEDAEYIIGDEAAELTVTAHTGDKGELSYQWYRNGEDSNEGGTLIEGEDEARYTPSVDTAGTVYYYVIVTNTLNKKTAVAVSNTAAVTVYEIEEGTTVINNAAVTVTAPAKGSTPDATATVDGAGYTCGAVSWSPGDNPFLGGTVYTAAVTLTADDGYVFAPGLVAAINHHDAHISHNNIHTVTLSLAFDATLTKTVTGIAIKDEPSKLEYAHGDALDLSGLAVTLTHDDGTSEEITFDGFGTNIATEPANGAALSHTDHNGRPVAVSFGGLTVDTRHLTVNAKALTVTGATHTRPYDGTTTASGVTITLAGIIGGDDVSVGTVTAEYANAAAGTQTVNITGVTLTGTAAGNYTVTLPANNVSVTGGITTANPAVTWPTAATITYGAALSTSALTGGTGDGTFAWTNSAAIPTVTNSGYEVTFTPTDTANYNTLTQNVSITVNKASGAAVNAPTLNTITHNSVTINPVTALTGQTVQYAKNTTNTAPADNNAWQTDTTLGDLSAGTTYYIFARSAGNDNYETGAASGSLTVTTLQTVPANRIEYYWVNEQDVIVGNAFTLPRGETLEITANDDGYSNQRWYINGAEDTLQTGNGTYFFSSEEKDVKRYTVTLIVEKGGKYYNANFMVTVTE